MKREKKLFRLELSGIGLNDSRWKGILQDYYTNYAATDAQGYLAMMEATKTIGTTMEDPTSDDYFNELEKHLGILSAALNQGQEATTQALNFTGKFATIQIVKNADGSITCKPWPSDLDPRDKNDEENTTDSPTTPGTCGKNHTVSLTAVAEEIQITPPDYTSVVRLLSGGTSVSEIVLCMTENDKYGKCTITPGSGYFDSVTISSTDGDGIIEIAGNVITAIGQGTAHVTVTGVGGDWSDAEPSTFTVVVHE